MPVEVCLTSNVVCGTVATYAEHHLGALLARGSPVALCTDDMGVFAAPLSAEFATAARNFGLSRGALAALAAAPLAWAFVDPPTRAGLQARFARDTAALLAAAE